MTAGIVDEVSTPTAAPQRATLAARALRVAEMVTTPLLPADYLDLISPMRTGADLRGRIVDIRRETADAVTLVIRPSRGWRGHVPGQYIRIGVDVDGVRQWRAYSLTCPLDAPDGCLTVTVKAIPDGKVSTHLVRHARPGTTIMLDQATGDFVLPERRPEKVLFLTAGSGITPVMGMLRNYLDELGDVVVLHSAPTAADVVFGAELRELAATGRITLLEQHTETAGLLTLDELASRVPDWAERHTWACGPTGLLDAAEEHWAAAGIADRIHTERFRPAIVAEGEGGTVAFTEQGHVVEADGATPILDAGEEAGVLMPSGCRMGICFGCVVPLRDGAVRDLRDGELTTATPENPVPIQTCVSAAAGPCEIEL